MTTVLAIEDDPAILRGLCDNLRFEGYDVIAASDGETGYRLQQERKPDRWTPTTPSRSTKPFSVRELMARVRALLRRSQAGPEGAPDLPDELRFGDVQIDFRSYEARRNGEPVEMTRKEFAILRFLASRETGCARAR